MSSQLQTPPYDRYDETLLEQAIDIYTQQTVEASVAELRHPDIFGLPDFAPHLNHEGYVTNFGDYQLGNGLFVTDSFAQRWSEQGIPNRWSFTPQPLLRSGRDDSRHKVFFGAMREEYFHGSDQHVTQIAVKPFGRDEETYAFHEFAMHEYLRQKGIPTFKALGMLALEPDELQDVPRLFLLSKFEPNVTTMDNIAWQSRSPEEQWQEVDRAVQTMVMLHDELIFYGDLRFKNIAFKQDGTPLVIDPETVVSGLYNAHPSGDRDRIASVMSKDFEEICASVSAFIIHPELDPENHRAFSPDDFTIYLERIYAPYFRHLTRRGGSNLDILHAAFQKVVEAHSRGESLSQPY